MRFNSLAFRLFATAAAWTLLVLPIAGFIIYRLYRDDVQTSFDGQLLKLVNAITVDSMGSSGDAQPLPPSNLYEPLFEVTHSGWYWQILPLTPRGGRKLVSPSLATWSLPSPAAKSIEPDPSGARWMNAKGPKGEPLRLVEVIDTLGHEPGKPSYSIVVAGPQDWLDHLVANFRYRLTTALALAGLGLVAVTLFQVRFGLLPLRQIERGLAGIRSGTATTLEGDLPAEIEPLQWELNALIRSNQAIVDRARTQVGNLAHALKTPLAVIANEARTDKTGIGDKIVEQAEIMKQSVTRYLDRARMAARVGVIGRVTPAAPVIEPLVRTLQRIHQEKGVVIKVDCPAEARFSGEKQDLEEMLGNLLDNACKWAKREVELTVEVPPSTSRAKNRRLAITVADDGPGLSEEERARIGKRGLRLDETKPGSGLGLSIVLELAHSYGGTCELAPAPQGGLAVHLNLPAG
ncbi:MAG: ATP-binding protein [Hyphomicrobium sp.]|nr:ATP-binding protein [Hyphomicrobium sp.]